MIDISLEQALQNGIEMKHSDMGNGELRYRLIGKDGSSYIRTEAHDSCMENAHFHKMCREMYIVQKGYIFMCELKDGKLAVQRLEEGNYFLTEPYIAHNVYMTNGAVTHTVKFGDCQQSDWYSSEELDELTAGLRQEDLEKML